MNWIRTETRTYGRADLLGDEKMTFEEVLASNKEAMKLVFLDAAKHVRLSRSGGFGTGGKLPTENDECRFSQSRRLNSISWSVFRSACILKTDLTGNQMR